MKINSDYEVADLALEIEERFNIDMSLEDMFSDDLNCYFNYERDEKKNTVTFFFEGYLGSCILTVNKPFTVNESYTINKILSYEMLAKQ